MRAPGVGISGARSFLATPWIGPSPSRSAQIGLPATASIC